MTSNSPREPRDADEEGSGGPDTSYFRYAAVGIQFAMTFLVCGAIGWWLDGKLGTAPWLMVVGIALGAAGAFTSLVRHVPPARGSRAKRGPRSPR